MHLKKVEISGFKSFARSTMLEFPSKITAVVGPNGSGKSNIAESIRWVLGEQSMKSLRGKKGEDLIWNGSPPPAGGVARMGKAGVALFFDNADKRIPIDFDEVVLERKIFRDGMNEYYINNSQVRLKDVVELMARVGLGESKHNIIGQGEVDRVILATPRERREMLEEALGLRIYQLRKNETERKLALTETNMRQVESLVREIAPHLRFLKAQAQKAEARETVEAELKEFQKAYFAKEREEIGAERKNIHGRAAPFLERQELVKKDIEKLLKEIAEAELAIAADDSGKSEEEKKLGEFEARRREFERELGRLEGKLEVEREKAAQPKLRVVDTRYIHEEIREIVSEIKTLLENEDRTDVMKPQLWVFVEDLELLLGQINRGTVEEDRGAERNPLLEELAKTIKEIQVELERVLGAIQNLQSIQQQSREKYRAIQIKIRELDSLLRAKQDEGRDLSLQLERTKFDEERIRVREEVWKKELLESGISEHDLGISPAEFESIRGEELKRKIERMRARLEEIGGIDETVVKEYQETEARHSFLSKELEDLKNAKTSLHELIKELETNIKEDFHIGFAKIKEEFHNYFRIIFGGGRATLQLVDVPMRGGSSEEEGEEDGESTRPTEPGVEVSIDLPKKRIKGLTMLSGGERALTSIALLFSITAVNPPPFLILDETDAALDEANSQRYSAILRELAKKTQLILVTHNRETMKCASILYGVTMGDDGVSKLLSLRLEEAEVYTNR